MAEVEMVIDSLRQSPVSHQWVAVLKDRSAERYLPVYIGSSQAEALRRELTNVKSPRVITQDFGLGIDTTNSRLASVIINRFEDNAFYAKLLMTSNGKAYEVDCPVAEALAIAVRAKAPIFTDEAILNRVGVTAGA